MLRWLRLEDQCDSGGGDLDTMNILLHMMLWGHGCVLIPVCLQHVMFVSLVFGALHQRPRRWGSNLVGCALFKYRVSVSRVKTLGLKFNGFTL